MSTHDNIQTITQQTTGQTHTGSEKRNKKINVSTIIYDTKSTDYVPYTWKQLQIYAISNC